MPDPIQVPNDRPEDDPGRTTDLSAASAPDTARRGETSLRTGHPAAPGATASFDPNKPTATFDSSRTGAHVASDEPDEVPSASGPTIPGYEILGELGRGGMGVVWKARQVKLNRTVALKMILAGPHAAPAAVARFEGEARAVARFQHPGIVQIFEVGEFAGMPFFSLEFVEGGPLSKKIAREPQPARYAAEVTEQLARAMQYAHDRGVIHRDLKPANVLLAADGTPKITDFGLAKELEGGSGQTHSGQLLGTPSFMAPEQADGRSDVGTLADVYALGGVLYDLLTGRPPFAGSSVLDTLEMVRTREPVAPGQLAARVPRDLETISLKCLQKDPARRYATAGELADDLRRFLDGRPILARPVSRAEKAWRWAKRNPWVAGLGTAAVVLLIATAATATTFAVVFDRQKAEAVALAASESQARAAEEAAKTEAQRKQKEAEAAREVAAEQRNQALSTIRGVLLYADNFMRNDANLAPVRLRIIEQMLRDLDKVRDLAVKNPLAGRTEGVAYSRIGELYLKSNRVSEAVVWSRKAYAVFEEEARRDPTNVAAVRDLAAIGNQLADVELRLGDAARARELYAEGLRLRQERLRLLTARGDRPELIPDANEDVATSYRLIADADLWLGEPDAAAEHYATADRGLAALPPPRVNSLMVLQERARIRDLLGDATFKLGDRDGAERHYRAALRDRQVLLGRTKNPVAAAALKSAVVQSHLVVGDFLLAGRDDPAGAAAEFRAAYQSLVPLLKAEPDNLTYRRFVAAAHYRFGVIAQQTAASRPAFGRLAAGALAAAHFKESLRLRAELGAIDSRDTQGLIEWMLALGRCGKAADARVLAWFLLKQAGRDRRVLFHTACGLAVASVGPTDPELAERCRSRAFELLDELAASGWKDRVALETDPDLASVRDDPQFRRVLEKIAARSNP
jgi:serine/threonine-protein kinase